MRGKKYSDEVKEKAYALYAVNGNLQETSKIIGVPANTISGWLKTKPPDKFDELRNKNKQRFIDEAGKLIEKGMTLIDRRFTRALLDEETINNIIDTIKNAAKNNDIDIHTASSLANAVRELTIPNIRDITTAVGTLYDKRALAQGDSTENTKIEFKLPKGVEEYAE